MKLDRIIEDLADPSTEIQVLALTTIPRMSPEFAISAEEMNKLMAHVNQLAAADNPDVVFLARKALNFLSSRGKARTGGHPVQSLSGGFPAISPAAAPAAAPAAPAPSPAPAP